MILSSVAVHLCHKIFASLILAEVTLFAHPDSIELNENDQFALAHLVTLEMHLRLASEENVRPIPNAPTTKLALTTLASMLVLVNADQTLIAKLRVISRSAHAQLELPEML